MSRFSIFCRNFSVSQCRKLPKVNPSVLYFSKFSGVKKLMDERGGEYQEFPSKTFCLTVSKEFVREPFRVSLILGMEKFCASEGYVTILDFLSKFFCLTLPKSFVGETFWAVFHKIFGSEKVYG